MADTIKLNVPDIGGATNVDVIEILVKPGDQIAVDTPLILLESDKASMEIPATCAGTVSELSVKIGDKVSEGDVILTLVADETREADEPVSEKVPSLTQPPIENPVKAKVEKISTFTAKKMDVLVPDIGGAQVEIIEIMVAVGETIEKDQSIITLEGDKATMDIPAPVSGKIEKILVKTGDKVSEGSLILIMETQVNEEITTPLSTPVIPQPVTPKQPSNEPKAVATIDTPDADAVTPAINGEIFAGPAVRRLARELGVNLSEVQGRGRKARITKEDVQAYIKSRLAETPSAGMAMPPAPIIDFSKFGSIEVKPLNKIKRLTGINVHRAWVTIPHVTQFDEADITELDAFRKNSEVSPQASYKLTVLAFVTKVVSKALITFPQFNASLDSTGENLVYKHYNNIGIAVETPNGLVVPVLKKVDILSVSDIAMEMARLSRQAREKGLMPGDMSGGCFTISSLGGIGGTAFTPIVNSPEVAILGLSRSSIKPVYINNEFKPRLMLPLSLSYDHRVIDGAEAARFTRFIAELLGDIRRMLL